MTKPQPAPGSDRAFAYLVPCAHCLAAVGETCRVPRIDEPRGPGTRKNAYPCNPHRSRVRAGQALAAAYQPSPPAPA